VWSEVRTLRRTIDRQLDMEPALRFDVPKPKQEGVMAHITLSRIRGSHCGEHTYVFWDGKEIGQVHRPNWRLDDPEPRWTVDYYGGNPAQLPSVMTDVFGVLKLAEHQARCIAEYQARCIAEYQARCIAEYQARCIAEYQAIGE